MALPSDSEFQRLAEEALDHLLPDNLEWNGFELLLRRSWKVNSPGNEPAVSIGQEMIQRFGPIRGMALKDEKSFSDFRAGIFSLRASKPDADLLVAVNDASLVTIAAAIDPPPPIPPLRDFSPIETEWLLSTFQPMMMMKVLALWPGLLIGARSRDRIDDAIGHMSLQIPTALWHRLTAREQSEMLDQLALLARDQYRLQSRTQDFRRRLSVALVANLRADSNILAEREIDAA